MQMSTKKLDVQFHLTATPLIRFASIGAVSEKSRRDLFSMYTWECVQVNASEVEKSKADGKKESSGSQRH
jgi:hypothetical protein